MKAAILHVPINFDRIWDESDPDYLLGIKAWVDEVGEVRKQMYQQLGIVV